ncbi:MAG: OpgC domain-containing protein [Rhodomicrobium sp.]
MNIFSTSARFIGGRAPIASLGPATPAPGPAAVQAVHELRTQKPHYDYRIDFFRGLSLIFIFINHIPDNFYSYFTSRTFALFDSAEVFMFLAGYSAALAYYSLLPQGLQAFARKAVVRARTMLLYHMVLVVIIMTAAYVLISAGVKTDYEVFIDKIESDPLQVIAGVPTLAFQAPLLDILPMYIMVILIAPFLIWLRAQSELALLSVSGMMWMFAARFFPAIPTVTYDVNWFFNPFCWQFLFAIGLIFGWRARTSMPPVAAGASRRVLDICCALFVIFSACVLMTIAFETIDFAASNRLRAMYFSLNKQSLDLWRVVGLLASAYLVARLISKNSEWLRTKPAGWVCAAGSFSLPIFSLTVVLSFAGKFFVKAMGPDYWILADTLATGAGLFIMLIVAQLLRRGLFQRLAESVFAPVSRPPSQQRQTG